MARRRKISTSGPQTSLQALLSCSPLPLARIATDAQVSTRTLVAITSSEIIAKIEKSKGEANRRHLAGLAASLTRLAKYLDLKPSEVLSEYGISTDNPLVEAAVARAALTSSRLWINDDPILLNIRGRAAEEDQIGGIA